MKFKKIDDIFDENLLNSSNKNFSNFNIFCSLFSMFINIISNKFNKLTNRQFVIEDF